jgi:hypothetical protein
MCELERKKEFVVPAPEYPRAAEACRLVYQQIVFTKQNNEHENLIQKTTQLAMEIAVKRNVGAEEVQFVEVQSSHWLV